MHIIAQGYRIQVLQEFHCSLVCGRQPVQQPLEPQVQKSTFA